jgi:type VI secretion system Hcp family effector
VTLESQKGTIEVLSLSNSILNPVQGCAGGSSCAGKAVFSDMVIQKRFDSSSPPLFLALATGKRFPNVVISFLRSGGDTFTKVFTIILSDAAVTKFETNSTADNALRGLGQEQINLSYSQIILRNDLTGKRACWNVVLNKAC